ncbi:hypothetical protein DZG01_28710 [Pseudomonas fluorescens]|nr:hypothetical protein DZG01_28710 [Pseudomonas fluorescens]
MQSEARIDAGFVVSAGWFFSVCTGLIASRLAPTGELCKPQTQCGSEPARDGGAEDNKKPADNHSSAGFVTSSTGTQAWRSCIRASCRSSNDG